MGDRAALIGGLGFVAAQSSAAAAKGGSCGAVAPGGFGEVIASGIDGEGSPADGEDIGRGRRVFDARTVIAGGGDEGDAVVTGGGGEVGIEGGDAGVFGHSPAHGDNGDAGLIASGVDGGEEIIGGGGIGFDENDLGARGDGVGPLDVEGGFHRPGVAGAGGVGGGEHGAAGFVQEGEGGIHEAELLIEGVEIGGDGGIVVGVDDGDGLAGTVGGGTVEGEAGEAVGLSNLCGAVACGSGGGVGGGNAALIFGGDDVIGMSNGRGMGRAPVRAMDAADR